MARTISASSVSGGSDAGTHVGIAVMGDLVAGRDDLGAASG